jgi:O-methyltransferase
VRMRHRLTLQAVGMEVALHTRLKYWAFYTYSYMFTPTQLNFLCSKLSSSMNVPGGVLEVGCAFGNTTVFLNRHMDTEELERAYWCVDTFSGFLPNDVSYERLSRGKAGVGYAEFAVNDIRWFRKTMEINGITRVKVIQADASLVDYSSFGPLAFALIDVDLYRPVAACLEKVWNSLSPGGIVIVDDCETGVMGDRYDGALHAYREFVNNRGLPEVIELGKLGVIQKEQ